MRLLPANVGYPPMTASGRCYVAGCTNGDAPRAENTVVVDLETQIEMEGWLVICEDCAEQIAGLLGGVSQSQASRYQGQIRNLKERVAELEAEKDAITSRLLSAVNG